MFILKASVPDAAMATNKKKEKKMEETKEYTMPLIGDPAPPFKAVTTQGEINFPEDFKGKWVILFSHPADFTPVCTTEFMTFASLEEEFKKLNTQLIGLSVDSLYAQSTTQAVRAVFIIDPKAVIRAILYYPSSTGRNFDEIKRMIVALQKADKEGIATPADWRPGEDCIIPPAGSCGTAKERMESKDADKYCLDWFMCFKKEKK